MKIYTKTGDKGETSLIGNKRVSKSDPRIIAYGSIDELNSNIGLSISILNLKNRDTFSDLIDLLVKVQNDLFIIGSDLADPAYLLENEGDTPRAEENMASHLERVIDKFETELLPINFFILPGGSIESSLLHISRSIARRAETTVTALSKSQTINPAIITYLNRLSDMLFVAARLINKRMGVEDVPWRSSPKY
ncbi:MAG: cob(I)yrinic acid a,c-diamide adenosyltransferase [Nitrososphaeraceae archaeon]